MSNKEQFKKDREYQYDFKDDVKSIFSTGTGLSEDIIRAISKEKNEPEWMLEFRLDAYRKFIKMPNPSFGPDVSNLDFDSYTYYTRYVKGDKTDWNDVPETIKNTFNKLGAVLSKSIVPLKGGLANIIEYLSLSVLSSDIESL